jgi:hypothetical protein
VAAAQSTDGPPDLQRLAAEQVAGYLEAAAVGSSLPIDPSAELCDILELLVPEILRRTNPEWRSESIDGFFFSSAVKTGEDSAELTGTCILISDQTVTPFAIGVRLSDPGRFQSLRIKLGEPGNGSLGISGPPCTSGAAETMLQTLSARVEAIDWVYDVRVGESP